MIISKAKTSTLSSLSIFLLLNFGLAALLFYHLSKGQSAAWVFWSLGVLFIILLVIGVLVGIKLLLTLKTIKIEKNQFELSAFWMPKSIRFSIKEIQHWKEEKIPTRGSTFKQLTISYQDKFQLKISNQEASRYDDIVKYLKKKGVKNVQ